MKYKIGTPKERLKLGSKVNEITGCIEWQKTKDGSFGYGIIVIGSRTDGTRRRIKTHRLVYELSFGPIPEGLWILHKCDNPPCINIDHLYLGNRQDNVNDRERRGRNKISQIICSGESSPNSKLTWDQVNEIRKLKGTMTHFAISSQFHVSPSNITQILTNKTWKVPVLTEDMK